jgi:hypothetical protein
VLHSNLFFLTTMDTGYPCQSAPQLNTEHILQAL